MNKALQKHDWNKAFVFIKTGFPYVILNLGIIHKFFNNTWVLATDGIDYNIKTLKYRHNDIITVKVIVHISEELRRLLN